MTRYKPITRRWRLTPTTYLWITADDSKDQPTRVRLIHDTGFVCGRIHDIHNVISWLYMAQRLGLMSRSMINDVFAFVIS